MSIHVLYHANCPDGFGAALACWMKFGSNAKYHPVRYGAPPPITPEQHDIIYVVDFSYPYAVLEAWSAIGCLIDIYDHHKTAQDDVLRAEKELPHIVVAFDLNESGATLVWKRLHATEDVPLLFRYLRDRDFWLWELENSKEVSAALRSYPTEFTVWAAYLDDARIPALASEGTSILRHIKKQVRAACRSAILAKIGGHIVPCVHTTLYGSEIGNELCQRWPDAAFAVCYSQQGTPDNRYWRYGLRSIGEFDVSEIAKGYGGGGHQNAAGFVYGNNICVP